MRTSKNATGGEEDLNFLDTLERHNNSSKSFIVHNNWKQKVDFIELNYYRRVHILVQVRYYLFLMLSGLPISDLSHMSSLKKFQGRVNDLGWEIYPEGLYEILTFVKNGKNLYSSRRMVLRINLII